MSISKIALAIPLALGIGCSTSGTQSSDHTGAMWPDRVATDGSMPGDPPPRGAEALVTPPAPAGSQGGLAVQPASGSLDGAVAANDPSSASPSGSSGSSDSSSGSSMGSSGSSGSTDSPGSSVNSGGAMGSGGSSETMGTEHQGGGSSDQAQQGAAAGPGNTGAHEGDQMVRGKLSKVSKDEISISAKGGEAKTLKINPDTVVTINGKDAKPTQLKKGQSVRASYENVSGDDVAVKIEVGKMRQGKHSGMHMKSHHGGASGGSDSSSGGSSGMGGGSDGGSTGGTH